MVLDASTVLGTEIQKKNCRLLFAYPDSFNKNYSSISFNGNIILALPYRIQGFESIPTSLQTHNIEELSSCIPDRVPNP